jgi:hypothetical protein
MTDTQQDKRQIGVRSMNPIWTKKIFGIHKTPVKRTNPPRIRENVRVFRAAHPKNRKAHPQR